MRKLCDVKVIGYLIVTFKSDSSERGDEKKVK